MTAIAYIHGFNSAPNTKTFIGLKERLPDLHVVSLEYDYINPDPAYLNLLAQAEELLTEDPDIVFVGTSLGGFWAHKLSVRFNATCVLVNPSIHPCVSLQKYIGDNVNYSTSEIKTLTKSNCDSYKKYEEDVNLFIPRSRTVVVLGMKDDVLDPSETEAFFKDAAEIIKIEDMGHRVENIELLINIINSTLDNITDERL